MSASLIFRDVFWVWTASEVIVLAGTRTGDRLEVRDRGSFLLLVPVIFASVWLGMDYGGTHAHTMGGPWWIDAGLAMLLAGLVIRWSAIALLGRSFSSNVAIHKTQILYRGGLFRVVRHPSYTGIVLIFVGIGMATRNWIAFAILTVPTVMALLYRIHVEEDALRFAFGEQYADYSRATKRLIPGIF
jgi:protein-S-isoprenylcysteine O-methyltransferase Ste14